MLIPPIFTLNSFLLLSPKHFIMKKLAFYTMTVCLLMTFSMNEVKAINSQSKIAIATDRAPQSAEVQAMMDRLEQIKAMDLSGMTTVEKRELRKEVRAIKHDMRAVSGIYLSIGALIIIILLLILLL